MSSNGKLRLGIEYFKQSRYEDALEAFNQAIREDEKNKTLFDSRAAVLEKLHRPLDALKDSKKVIDLAPVSWQGYARSARLFLQIEKPSASFKMADLALDRMTCSDLKRRAEVQAVREKALKALERPPCFFSRLPIEIQTEILSLVINGSNVKMLALTLVCRCWREIIISTPRFWRHLTLTPKTTLKKTDAWLQRSRGILSNLYISSGFSFTTRPNVLRKASSIFWSSLDALEIHIKEGNIDTILPPEAPVELRLHSLVIDIADTSNLWRFIHNLDKSRTRHLTLMVGPYIIPLAGCGFVGLNSLRLSGGIPYTELFEILRRNATLETLILDQSKNILLFDEPLDDIESVELNNLKHLELSDNYRSHFFLSNLHFPNLRVLSLSHCRSGACFISFDVIDQQRLLHLEELHLHRCGIPGPTLFSILHRAKGLTTLSLSYCMSLTDSINLVIEGLAKPVSNGESPPIIPCPRLQRIDLSSSPDLKTGPVIRLVKAHLGETPATSDDNADSLTPPDESQDVLLPVLYLNINDCDLIGADALPWLRAKVPHLTYKMKPVKMGKGRK